jgi:hypothetical protein
LEWHETLKRFTKGIEQKPHVFNPMVVDPSITLATRKGMSSNVTGRDVSLIH